MTDHRGEAATPRYRLAEGRTVWRSVGAEGVVLDLRQSVYFRLNKSGRTLWAMLVDGCSAEDLARAVMADRSIERDLAMVEVTDFLGAIDSQGLFDDVQPHG